MGCCTVKGQDITKKRHKVGYLIRVSQGQELIRSKGLSRDKVDYEPRKSENAFRIQNRRSRAYPPCSHSVLLEQRRRQKKEVG